MSIHLIRDLHAGISRYWHAVETAANRIRDDVEKTVAILAGTGIGGLPNDYPLSRLAANAINPSPETNVTGADLVAKIAHVASGVGFQANVPALDIAGQILSILAAIPEHIDRFMVEGTELFLDGTFNYENGSLTYRAVNGSILSPSVLRERKGSQQ